MPKAVELLRSRAGPPQICLRLEAHSCTSWWLCSWDGSSQRWLNCLTLRGLTDLSQHLPWFALWEEKLERGIYPKSHSTSDLLPETPQPEHESSKNTSFYSCKGCHFPQCPHSASSTSSRPWSIYAKDSGNLGGFSWATFSSKGQMLPIKTNRLQVTQAARLMSANNDVSDFSSH